MKNPLRRNPIASAETELANLAARRETLENRKAGAIATLEAARSARKNALANDPGAELSGLTRSVRDGEDEVETLTGVLADLAEQVSDAERRLAEAQDADVRAAAAKTLESVAVAVDNAAAELERGLAIVGKAYAALVAAVPETLQVVDLDERVIPHERSRWADAIAGGFELKTTRQPALPNDLARAILAEGIAKACPMAFGYGRRDGFYHVALSRAEKLGTDYPSFKIDSLVTLAVEQSAAEAAALLVSRRLRDRARHIVAGDMSPDLEDAPIFRPAPAPVRIPLVEVFALENFAFQIEEGKLATLVGKRWAHQVPEDAANAAVAAGLALRTDTKEGEKAFQDEKTRRAASRQSGSNSFLSRDMCHDLGVIRKPADDGDNVVGIISKAVAA